MDSLVLLLVPGLGPDDVVLETQEEVEILEREPEEPQEHRAGERDRERAVELALARVDELVDQLVAELADVVLEQRDLLRREERVEQPPVLHVLGRVDLQRDERPHVADRDRVHVGREKVGVPQRELDVLVAGDHRAAELGAQDRRVLAQHVVDRLRLGRIEVELPRGHLGRFGHRFRLGHGRPSQLDGSAPT